MWSLSHLSGQWTSHFVVLKHSLVRTSSWILNSHMPTTISPSPEAIAHDIYLWGPRAWQLQKKQGIQHKWCYLDHLLVIPSSQFLPRERHTWNRCSTQAASPAYPAPPLSPQRHSPCRRADLTKEIACLSRRCPEASVDAASFHISIRTNTWTAQSLVTLTY